MKRLILLAPLLMGSTCQTVPYVGAEAFEYDGQTGTGLNAGVQFVPIEEARRSLPGSFWIERPAEGSAFPASPAPFVAAAPVEAPPETQEGKGVSKPPESAQEWLAWLWGLSSATILGFALGALLWPLFKKRWGGNGG